MVNIGQEKQNKTLARQLKKKDVTQIKKLINERENITTHTPEIRRIRDYKQLHTNKLDNLEEMGKFPETHNLSRLNHKQKI